MAAFLAERKNGDCDRCCSWYWLGGRAGTGRDGADIAIWYNTNKKCPLRAAELEQKYGVKYGSCPCHSVRRKTKRQTGRAYQVDVLDPVAVQAAVDAQVSEFNGRLDIFVANAGIPWTKGPIVDGDLAHYHDVVKTDLDGTYFSAKAAASHWRREKVEGTDMNGTKLENYTSGSFMTTASMSGVIVNIPQLQAAYNAAKAGVIHLCRSLAVEWAHYARANAVSPGYIITEISNFVPQEIKDIWQSKIPLG